MLNYEEKIIGDFHLQVRSDVPTAWLKHIVEHLDDIVVVNKDRRRGSLPLPSELGKGQAFVKAFPQVYDRHSMAKHQGKLSKPGYAVIEADAYLRLQKTAVNIPALYIYGEEWRDGVRYKGLLVTGLEPGPTLYEVIEKDRADGLEASKRCVSELGKMHAAGYSHGDAHPRNFIVRDDTVVVIDLEGSSALKKRRHFSDVVRMLRTGFIAGEGSWRAANAVADSYAATGAKFPEPRWWMLFRAWKKARARRFDLDRLVPLHPTVDD